MRKVSIFVLALVLVFGMSTVVAASWVNSDLPEEDPRVNILEDEQEIETSVGVNPFATFVYKSAGDVDNFPVPGDINQDFDPSNVDDFTYSDDLIIDPSAPEVDGSSSVVGLAQYKWTMRTNCDTQTTVETETDTGLSDNVTVFYEFSAEHDSLNVPEWYSYLGPNDSEAFNTQAWADLDEGTETGWVMVGMDPADYKDNWTKVKADDYNMKVTFTISHSNA